MRPTNESASGPVVSRAEPHPRVVDRDDLAVRIQHRDVTDERSEDRGVQRFAGDERALAVEPGHRVGHDLADEPELLDELGGPVPRASADVQDDRPAYGRVGDQRQRQQGPAPIEVRAARSAAAVSGTSSAELQITD